MQTATYSINGNLYSNGKSVVYRATASNVCSWNGWSVKYYRPNYGGGTPTLNANISASDYLKYYAKSVTAYSDTVVPISSDIPIWRLPWTDGNNAALRVTTTSSALETSNKVTNHLGNLWYQVSNGFVYSGNVEPAIRVSSVTIYPTESISLTVNDTYHVMAIVAPTNAYNQALSWSSSNTSVATIRADAGDSSGAVIAATGIGTTTITATAQDGSGCSASRTVTVSPIYVTSVGVSPSTLLLTEGDTTTLSTFVSPSNASNRSVSWSSSNTSVATVNSSGCVTAVGAGSATIRATANDGSGCSGTCAVTVNAAVTAPVITQHPADQTATPGTIVFFSVTATGTTPLTYRWYVENLWGDVVHSEEGADAYFGLETGIYLIGENTVYCVVSNAAGSATSNRANYTVIAGPNAPVITRQPVSQTVTEGGSVTFTVAASGAAPLRYQWFRALPGEDTFHLLEGFNNPSYMIPSALLSYDGYQYLCEVSNSDGYEDSQIVTLTVTPCAPPVLNSVTSSAASAAVGQTVKWTPQVTGGSGTKTYYYRLFKSGTSAPIDTKQWVSAATYSYTFAEAGSYTLRVRVKDGNGVLTEYVNSSRVVVNAKIALTGITPSSATASVGESITWTPQATGGVGVKSYYYRLYKSGTSAPIDTKTWVSAATYSYTFTEAGSYTLRVRVKDGNGTLTEYVNSAQVTVAEKITLTEVAASSRTSAVGGSVTWTPQVTGGSGTKTYYYRLFKSGTSAPIDTKTWVSAATYSYTFTEAGSYTLRVRVKDGNGVLTEHLNSAKVTVAG